MTQLFLPELIKSKGIFESTKACLKYKQPPDVLSITRLKGCVAKAWHLSTWLHYELAFRLKFQLVYIHSSRYS